MAWIELHQSVIKHRKTLAVAEALGKPRQLIVGHLSELWCWAIDAAPEGGPLSAQQLKEGAGWAGNAQRFADALCTAGYIDVTDCGYALHNWPDYAERLSQKRHANKVRQRKHREEIRNGHVTQT